MEYCHKGYFLVNLEIKNLATSIWDRGLDVVADGMVMARDLLDKANYWIFSRDVIFGLTCNMKMVVACANPWELSGHDARNGAGFHPHSASFFRTEINCLKNDGRRQKRHEETMSKRTTITTQKVLIMIDSSFKRFCEWLKSWIGCHDLIRNLKKHLNLGFLLVSSSSSCGCQWGGVALNSKPERDKCNCQTIKYLFLTPTLSLQHSFSVSHTHTFSFPLFSHVCMGDLMTP